MQVLINVPDFSFEFLDWNFSWISVISLEKMGDDCSQ